MMEILKMKRMNIGPIVECRTRKLVGIIIGAGLGKPDICINVAAYRNFMENPDVSDCELLLLKKSNSSMRMFYISLYSFSHLDDVIIESVLNIKECCLEKRINFVYF